MNARKTKILFRCLVLSAAVFLLPTTSYEQGSSPIWNSADVGNVAAAGSSLFEGSTTAAYINGAGSGVTGSNDSFHFLYTSMVGDGEITAHLSAEVLASGSAQAGLMMRETLATNSTNAFLAASSSTKYVSLSQRATTGGTESLFPYSTQQLTWLKLVRVGNYFSSYVSADGQKWLYLDCRSIPMAQQICAGFAVASNTTDGSICSAIFDQVRVRTNNVGTVSTPVSLIASNITDQSVHLQWSAPTNAPSGLTYDLFRDGVQVATGLSTTSIDDGLRASGTTFNYAVRAVSADGLSISSSASTSLSTLSGGSVASPWATQLVGTASKPGAGTVSTGTPLYTLNVSGGDIFGAADSCRFVYQPINGDVLIIARVDSCTQADPYIKPGLMIRESLAANAVEACLVATPGHEVGFVQRLTTGANCTQPLNDSSLKLPCWLMLSRKGNTFDSYCSPDGVTWTLVYHATITMASNAYVGMALASHFNALLAQSTMDQVKVIVDSQPPTQPTNVSAKAGDTFVTLSWEKATDDGQVVGYDIYRDGTKVGTANTTSYMDRGLQLASQHSYTVLARDAAGNTSTTTQPLNVTTLVNSLPAPWQHFDLNTVGVPGRADFTPSSGDATGVDTTQGVFTVDASGAGIGLNDYTDHCHYVYRPVSGDFQMTARIADVAATTVSSMAGIMFRETLDKGSRDLALMVSAANGVTFYRRFNAYTTSSAATSLGTPPSWVRLQRRGSVLTALVSTNGTDWVQVGSEVMDFSGQLFIGLAATSFKDTALTTAHLDQVSLQLDSDGDGLYDGSTPPAQPPGYVTGAAVANFFAASLTGSVGPWIVNNDTGFVENDGGRGYVEYAFNVPNRDIYEIVISGGGVHYDPYTRAYNLIVSIDGVSLGSYPLFSVHGGFASINVLSPYLKEGAHTLRIFWDNTDASRTFSLQQIQVVPVTAAATNGSGITDWVGDHLSRNNAMDAVATVSATSPLCIEGRAEFFDNLSITAVNVGPVPTFHGPQTRWYANVPLSQNSPTQIDASFEQGALTQTSTVSWATTDLLTSPSLTIRAGDSLLLMAAPGGATSGAVQIQVSGPTSYNATTSPGAPVPVRFASSGVYTLTGTYQNGSQTASRSVQLKVMSATFNGNPAAYVGRSRPWDNPLIAPSFSIDADARMEFIRSGVLSGGGTRFSFVADRPEPRYVLARLPGEGAVLTNATITPFDLAFSSNTYVRIVQTNPDGSQVLETSMVLSQVIPGITYQISLVASGITFEDGTIVKTLTAADFDATGTVRVRLVRAPNNSRPICNVIQVFDGTTSIGYR